MNHMTHMLPLDRLQPHSGNPRLIERSEVIDQLAALMRERGFDHAHAIIVRPMGEGWYQIVSGHNRVKAAAKAELAVAPAWVREMGDDEAYMQLVLANTQGELSPLERGFHALKSKKTVREYAAHVGRSHNTVDNEIRAARVSDACPARGTKLDGHFASLVEIHAAERWLWPALVFKTIDDDLKRDDTRDLVRSLKDAPEQKWSFAWDRIGEHVVKGTLALDDVQKMLDLCQHYAGRHGESEVDKVLTGKKVSTPSQLSQALLPLAGDTWTEPEMELAVPLFSIVSLKQWEELDDSTRRILLDPSKLPATGTFNVQTGDGIEWAKWSWNPITGCLHDCPYCYARDIATIGNTARAFPHGFEPALKPVHLNTPHNMNVPKGAHSDTRLRNVFCGSMSDWWGRWVPEAWVNSVLDAMRGAPGFNFLTLTKFPKRMAEFDIPGNVWAGTTVDCQARVRNAEAAFADIDAAVRWYSIEPMLERLRFSRLDLVQWIVIGGASRSSRTPEWKPPFAWIADLVAQAREANVAVYMKPNLYGHRVLEMPGGLPVPQDYPAEPPAVFNYLRDKRTLEAKPLPAIRSETSA